jgi:hypothetical protein
MTPARINPDLKRPCGDTGHARLHGYQIACRVVGAAAVSADKAGRFKGRLADESATPYGGSVPGRSSMQELLFSSRAAGCPV